MVGLIPINMGRPSTFSRRQREERRIGLATAKARGRRLEQERHLADGPGDVPEMVVVNPKRKPTIKELGQLFQTMFTVLEVSKLNLGLFLGLPHY